MIRSWQGDVAAAVEQGGSVLTFLLPIAMAYTPAPSPDWLVQPIARVAEAKVRGNEISLENGLVRRTFRIAPNAACVALDNLTTGVSMLRAVQPEATIELDGRRFDVGGLRGQPDLAYLLPGWLEAMTADPSAFRYAGHGVGKPEKRFEWKRVRHSEGLDWPPRGVSLTLQFGPPLEAERYRGLVVEVHYELYDGIPAMAKWLTVANGSSHDVRLNRFENEVLDLAEYESSVEDDKHLRKPLIHLQSATRSGAELPAAPTRRRFGSRNAHSPPRSTTTS